MIPSPCIGRCRIDAASRLCGGCARSGAEVAAWRDADSHLRDLVWADLPRRRAALGITLYRHGWSPAETLAFVRQTFEANHGSWTVGDQVASARWATKGVDRAGVCEQGSALSARTPLVAVRFDLDDRVRVLATPGLGQRKVACERIVLAIPKSGDRPEPATALTPLGDDTGAIQPADRAAQWFDLGLGQSATRIGLRTHDPTAAADLASRSGDPWSAVLPAIGSWLATARGTTGIIETPLVRLEVAGSVAFGPTGLLRVDRAAGALDPVDPPGLDLPPTFLPCAWFDPVPSGPGLALLRWARRLVGRS